MKIIRTLVLSLASLMAVAIFAQSGAQPKMDTFNFHVSDLSVLQDRRVQTELKVTDQQRARMNTFADRHNQRLQSLAQEYEKQKKNPLEINSDPKAVGY
jgi:Spy/CpxP family protein refolding chaperone